MGRGRAPADLLFLPAPPPAGAAGAPRGLLSPALFQARVIPELLRLFAVHEEHVRVVLLSHLEAYVEHFTPEQLRKVILPQVRDGRGARIRAGGPGPRLVARPPVSVPLAAGEKGRIVRSLCGGPSTLGVHDLQT